MKKTLQFILFLTCFIATAQVKIGNNITTIGTSSLLELEDTSRALVLTRVASTTSITTPVNGMLVYDISSNCIKAYENGAWSSCLSSQPPSVVQSCGGFSGTYNINQPLSTSPATCKYSVTITNNTFSTTTIALATTDLVLTGVSGYTVSDIKIGGSSVTSVTLAGGAIAVIDYIISGTCTTTGTLTGTWAKSNLNCSNTTPVTSNIWVNSLTCGSGVFAPAGDFVQGVAYTGTLTVPYTGGNSLAYPSQTITSTGILGFTAVLRAGTLSNNAGGNLVFDVTGTTTATTGSAGYTPSGATTGANFVINFGSQTCTMTQVVIPNYEIIYNIDYGNSSNASIYNSVKTLNALTYNSAGYVTADFINGINARFPYKGTYTITYAIRTNIAMTGYNRWDNNMSAPISVAIDTDIANGGTGAAKTFTATGVTAGSVCSSWLQACGGCTPNTTVNYNATPNKILTIKLTSHN